MAPDRTTSSAKVARATIAAMPNKLRPILLALMLAGASSGVLGCGSSNGPSPSLSAQEAAVLTSKIDEIKANVDVGSCLVAAAKTDDLIADINDLPSSVNANVKHALDTGANNLKLLLTDPAKCQGRAATTTSTSTPSTTESTTTTRTEPTTSTTRTQTQPNTTTQTQTTSTTTPGSSGGVGPGGL
jgi:hypothetical protein